tara:strand:+ start:1336 stop:1584 length:249 start_codon:yes stop_codon:yes gene_type:complete
MDGNKGRVEASDLFVAKFPETVKPKPCPECNHDNYTNGDDRDKHCPTCKCDSDEKALNYHYKIRHCPNCNARVWCQECATEL